MIVSERSSLRLEQYVGLWIALGTAEINLHIHRAG
jgi:hypothetical protein